MVPYEDNDRIVGLTINNGMNNGANSGWLWVMIILLGIVPMIKYT